MSRTRCAAVLFAACVTIAGIASADDLRIENEVVEGENATQSTTLFHGGVVYSFLGQPEEIVRLDMATRRFTLVKPQRGIKCEISIDVVEQSCRRFQQGLATHTDASVKFLAMPTFTERIDADGKTLVLDSQWLEYRVITAAARNAKTVDEYRTFSDAYMQLNTVLSRYQKLPFARLELNRALAQRNAVPLDVRLTVRPPNAAPFSARSSHVVTYGLSQIDLDRISRAERAIANCRDADLSDFVAPIVKQAAR